MIKEVEAFKSSDGKLHTSKAAAVNAEKQLVLKKYFHHEGSGGYLDRYYSPYTAINQLIANFDAIKKDLEKIED